MTNHRQKTNHLLILLLEGLQQNQTSQTTIYRLVDLKTRKYNDLGCMIFVENRKPRFQKRRPNQDF